MVSATPASPAKYLSAINNSNIKIAAPDILASQADRMSSIETATLPAMDFEGISGQELISIARHDLVNGQDVAYSPIKNLATIFSQYNPQNLVSLQNTSSEYFNNYPIRLENHIPEPGSGTGPLNQSVYVDEGTGDLIVNIVNLPEDQQVEIQILSAGTTLNGTIYT